MSWIAANLDLIAELALAHAVLAPVLAALGVRTASA